MSLLIFGKTGQVARALARVCPDARFLDRTEADLSDPQTCAARILESDARAVINAAAYTAVDEAEADETTAYLINADAPEVMASAAAAKGIPFINLSTDYVFNGRGSRPWTVEDTPDPLNAYGRSKHTGEQAVQAAGGAYAILRTSWVFSATGANFVKTILRQSRSRDRLEIVADQIGGPTPASAIAEALVVIADALATGQAASGIFHFSGAPDVSRADFARDICRQTGREVTITDIATRDYPTPARRPLNSRLDCSATLAEFGLSRPDWRNGVKTVLHKLGGLR